jgi:hypothetical protein
MARLHQQAWNWLRVSDNTFKSLLRNMALIFETFSTQMRQDYSMGKHHFFTFVPVILCADLMDSMPPD